MCCTRELVESPGLFLNKKIYKSALVLFENVMPLEFETKSTLLLLTVLSQVNCWLVLIKVLLQYIENG